MAVTRRRADAQGVGLTTSLATIFAFNTGLAAGGGILQGVLLANRSGNQRIVTIEVIEQGGVAANNKIVGVRTVPANSDDVWVGPYYCNSGAFVQAKMDGGATDDVIAHAIAIEVS